MCQPFLFVVKDETQAALRTLPGLLTIEPPG